MRILLLLLTLLFSPGLFRHADLLQAKHADEPLFWFEQRGLYGFTDARGQVVIEPKFHSANEFSEGLAAVQMCTDEGLKYGYIDRSGTIVIPPTFDLAGDFSDGLAAVSLDGPWGFIDKTGTLVIQPKYSADDFTPLKFSEGFAAVKIGERWGYINKNDEVIAKPRFESAGPFSEGMAEVEINDKFGYIDTSGKMVIKPKFDLAAEFSEGLARVNLGYRFGWNNQDPRRREGLWGYIDKSGELVIAAKYYWADSFSEGLAVVSADEGVGFIDRTGRVAIEFKYQWGSKFSEGLAAVKLNGKWGYIDTTGKTTIPLTLGESRSFANGVAPANNWYNRINKQGEIIWTHPPVDSQSYSIPICEPKVKPPPPTPEENAVRRKHIHKLMLKGEYQHDGAGELMYIGNITSVPALLRVLKDHPPSVTSDGSLIAICTYSHAVTALVKITGYQFRTYDEWSKWWDDYRRTHPVK